jgi:Skp family chaperone for outer membrane proteins
VKRKFAFAAGLAALGIMGYLGTQLIAQSYTGKDGAKPAPASPKTRIAVFNLSHVVENYDRFKVFLEETKEDIKSYDEQLKPMLKTFDDKAALMRTEKDEAKREQLSSDLKKMEYDIKTLKDKGQKDVVRKEAIQFKLIYRDVEVAVEKYAKAYGIELVMHYNDFVGDKKDTPENARNKLGYAPLFPVYSAPGIDVTRDILSNLNAAYQTSVKKKTGGAGAGH